METFKLTVAWILEQLVTIILPMLSPEQTSTEIIISKPMIVNELFTLEINFYNASLCLFFHWPVPCSDPIPLLYQFWYSSWYNTSNSMQRAHLRQLSWNDIKHLSSVVFCAISSLLVVANTVEWRYQRLPFWNINQGK